MIQRIAPKWLVSQVTGLPVSCFHTHFANQVLAQWGIPIVSDQVKTFGGGIMSDVVGTVISDQETPNFETVRIKLMAGKYVKPGTLLRIPISRPERHRADRKSSKCIRK